MFGFQVDESNNNGGSKTEQEREPNYDVFEAIMLDAPGYLMALELEWYKLVTEDAPHGIRTHVLRVIQELRNLTTETSQTITALEHYQESERARQEFDDLSHTPF